MNCNEGGCIQCNGTSFPGNIAHECVCLHAEENALLEAGRERVGLGSVLYCNTFIRSVQVHQSTALTTHQMPMFEMHHQDNSDWGQGRRL
jgi:hypothetical protein